MFELLIATGTFIAQGVYVIVTVGITVGIACGILFALFRGVVEIFDY